MSAADGLASVSSSMATAAQGFSDVGGDGGGGAGLLDPPQADISSPRPVAANSRFTASYFLAVICSRIFFASAASFAVGATDTNFSRSALASSILLSDRYARPR